MVIETVESELSATDRISVDAGRLDIKDREESVRVKSIEKKEALFVDAETMEQMKRLVETFSVRAFYLSHNMFFDE